MPGIDFDRLRAEVTIEEVLNLLGFEPTRRFGRQRYGRCPLHPLASECGGSFSASMLLGRYYCHRCRSQCNTLELWATATWQPLHAAMIDLCDRLGREVPWIRRS
jgi:hypothetical protein